MNPWLTALLGAVVGAGAVILFVPREAPPRVEPRVATATASATATPRAPEPTPAGTLPPAPPAAESPEVAPAPGTPPAPPATAQAAPRGGADAPTQADAAPPAPSPCPELEQIRGDLTAAQARAESCEERLSRADTRIFDLDESTLSHMAERCELRWDLQPPRLDGPAGLPPDAATKVELGPEEMDEVAGVLRDYNDRMLSSVRALYTEITGDEEVANLAPDAMLAEIDDKTAPEELRRVFQQLSAERAGRAAPPSDPAAGPAIERLYRLLTTAGDDLEGALATRIGSSKAHALRELEGGWGSRSRSTRGCPEEP